MEERVAPYVPFSVPIFDAGISYNKIISSLLDNRPSHFFVKTNETHSLYLSPRYLAIVSPRRR